MVASSSRISFLLHTLLYRNLLPQISSDQKNIFPNQYESSFFEILQTDLWWPVAAKMLIHNIKASLHIYGVFAFLQAWSIISNTGGGVSDVRDRLAISQTTCILRTCL